MSSSIAENQAEIFKYQREKYFKGTIAVAVIYGSIALIMFLIAIMTTSGKSILTEQLLPFTVTFIGGMIVVTLLMVVSVFAVKQPPVIEMQYDNLKCPDYWKLQPTPKSILENYHPSDQYMMKYMCVNNTFEGDIADFDIAAHPGFMSEPKEIQPSEVDKQKLYEAGQKMYGTLYMPPQGTEPGSGSIVCGALYPDWFNKLDVAHNKAQPNKLRCEYAKTCGIPWSSVCPNQM